MRSGYYDRKKAAGKTSMEAMRCLKRLSDLVCKTMLDDLVAAQKRGPETTGQRLCLARPAHSLRLDTVGSQESEPFPAHAGRTPCRGREVTRLR